MGYRFGGNISLENLGPSWGPEKASYDDVKCFLWYFTTEALFSSEKMVEDTGS